MPRARVISQQAAKVLRLFLSAPNEPRFARDVLIEVGLKSGSLYPLLRRLEEDGVLESRWESVDITARAGRRPRVEYRLVSGGEKARALLRERAAQTESERAAPAWRPRPA